MTIIQLDAASTRRRNGTHPTIDLVGPCEACDMLVVGDDDLLDMVNARKLAAYRLGGHVRFRSTEVAALANSQP